MKGLYSGRQIKDLAAKKLKITRSQTAAQAVKAITKKYGGVSDSGKYHHTGNGVWVKYSLANDSRRTGKLAISKAQWRAQPHKLDYPGIDTKGVEKKEVKPKLSVGMLKQGKPVGRGTHLKITTESGAKVNSLQRARRSVKLGYYFTEGFTWKTNGNTFKIVSITGSGNRNIKYINLKKPDKKYVTSEKDLTFDLRMNKDIRKINAESAKKDAEEKVREAEHKKKLDDEYKKQLEGLEGFELTVPVLRRTKLVEVLNTQIINNGRVVKRKDLISERIKAGWRIEAQTYTTSKKVRGERIGTDHKVNALTNGDLSFSLSKTEFNFATYLSKKLNVKPKFSLSSIKPPAKLSSRTKKTPAKMVYKAAVKSMPKKATSSARRRYASFNRPLGSWFNPGIPFKYEDTRASDKDFRYNRMPHTVISTETKISPEKIKSYELVDLVEGRKMQALIKYSNAVKYFTDSMKDQVERQILKGAIATRKDIEPYIAKAKKIMEKKEIKSNGSPYDTLKFKIRRTSVLSKPEKPKGRTAKKNMVMGDSFKYRPSAIQSLRLTQEQKAIIASRKAARVPAKKVRAKKVKLPPEEVEINKIRALEEKHNKLSNDIEKYLKVHYDFTKHLADMRQRKAPDTSGMEANISGTMEHVKKLRAEVEKIQEDIRQHKLKLRNIDEKKQKSKSSRQSKRRLE